MTKAGKVLTVLGLAAAVGGPVAVYAATRTPDAKSTTESEGTAKGASTAKDDTITCPLTGEQIKPCCCPINKDEKK
jgi:hypothetical protein